MSTELIYGIHAVSALLERTPSVSSRCMGPQKPRGRAAATLLAELESLGIRVQSVNRKTLYDKAEGNNHQGIMAKVIEALQAGRARPGQPAGRPGRAEGRAFPAGCWTG